VLTVLRPGGIREPHWHPSAWELNYVMSVVEPQGYHDTLLPADSVTHRGLLPGSTVGWQTGQVRRKIPGGRSQTGRLLTACNSLAKLVSSP
jgi:hypothetical protein